MTDAQTPIRIVIADDHPLVRDGSSKVFELQPGFTVVGEAADGREAVMPYKCIRAVMNGEFWVGHERINALVQTLRQIERVPSRAATPTLLRASDSAA